MNETRRAEIAQIVEHFRGKLVTNNVIVEYCNLNKIDPITHGEYKDYLYQVEHDEKILKLFPLILAEVQKLRYIPEFSDAQTRADIKEGNDKVRVAITMLFEEHAISYRTVETLGNELGRMLGGTVEQAGVTAFNKALEVLLHLAHKQFGEEFNMKHVADYALKIYEPKSKDSENTSTEVSEQSDKSKSE